MKIHPGEDADYYGEIRSLLADSFLVNISFEGVSCIFQKLNFKAFCSKGTRRVNAGP